MLYRNKHPYYAQYMYYKKRRMVDADCSTFNKFVAILSKLKGEYMRTHHISSIDPNMQLVWWRHHPLINLTECNIAVEVRRHGLRLMARMAAARAEGAIGRPSHDEDGSSRAASLRSGTALESLGTKASSARPAPPRPPRRRHGPRRTKAADSEVRVRRPRVVLTHRCGLSRAPAPPPLPPTLGSDGQVYPAQPTGPANPSGVYPWPRLLMHAPARIVVDGVAHNRIIDSDDEMLNKLYDTSVPALLDSSFELVFARTFPGVLSKDGGPRNIDYNAKEDRRDYCFEDILPRDAADLAAERGELMPDDYIPRRYITPEDAEADPADAETLMRMVSPDEEARENPFRAKPCIVEGCKASYFAFDLCLQHYHNPPVAKAPPLAPDDPLNAL